MGGIYIMKRTFKCPCDKKEHILDVRNSHVWDFVAKTIDELGENMTLQVLETGKKYSVPRIYIAMHGIKGHEVGKLGFKEI